MTTNPRFRAGQPASCAFVRSGCNWPESECAGNCKFKMHRVQPEQIDAMAELDRQIETAALRGQMKAAESAQVLGHLMFAKQPSQRVIDAIQGVHRPDRIDASQLTDNRAVMVAGDPEPNRSTLPTATEFAAPEPIDWQSFRFLVIGGAVIAITLLFGWRLV